MGQASLVSSVAGYRWPGARLNNALARCYEASRGTGVLWSLMSSSTSCMISAYRRCAVVAILINTPPLPSYAAVGCECRTKGTASSPYNLIDQSTLLAREKAETLGTLRAESEWCATARAYLDPFYLVVSQTPVRFQPWIQGRTN